MTFREIANKWHDMTSADDPEWEPIRQFANEIEKLCDEAIVTLELSESPAYSDAPAMHDIIREFIGRRRK